MFKRVDALRSWAIWCLFFVTGLAVAIGPTNVRAQDGGQGEAQEKAKEKKGGEKSSKKKDADKDAPEDPEAKDADEDAAKSPELSVDEAYVRENIKPFLNADKLEFDENGRVTIEFDFSKKKEEHMEVFQPPLSSKPQSNFRYTTGREERIDFFGMEGIKIANQGREVLKCWFLDDVEAEIRYIARGSFTANHMFALCFSDAQNKKAIGNNMGSQCVSLAGGMPAGRGQGTVEPTANATRTTFKLVVRGGKFESYKNGKKRSTMDYKPKDYSTGQIGFAWGGKIAGSVTYLKINGKIDSKKMLEVLRKTSRG